MRIFKIVKNTILKLVYYTFFLSFEQISVSTIKWRKRDLYCNRQNCNRECEMNTTTTKTDKIKQWKKERHSYCDSAEQ